MRFRTRAVAIAAAGPLLVLWLLAPAVQSADDKGLQDGVQKVGEAIEKKDKDGAKKSATDLAKKTEMEDLMHVLALRSKRGMGVGPKPGAVMPDGIEKKVEALVDKPLTAKQLADEAPALERMGWNVAAIGEICLAKPPEKDTGKKKVKDWVKWSEDLREAGAALATAAKDKNAQALQKAADKVNTNCNKCHDVFRYDN